MENIINDLSNADKTTVIISDLNVANREEIEVNGLSQIPLIKGKSAYEIALMNGFEGTEAEWLNSLKVDFQQSANEFLKEAQKEEKERINKEILRIEQEKNRTKAEEDRNLKENERSKQETFRIEAENVRKTEFEEMKLTFDNKRIESIENNISANSNSIQSLENEQIRLNEAIQNNTDNVSKITKQLTKKELIVTTEEIIKENTNYEVPKYQKMEIYFEGIKLIKNIHYIEVNDTNIQFKDWNVPSKSNIVFIYEEG